MILKGNAWSLKAEFALWALFAALLPLWENILPMLLGLLLLLRVLFRNERTNTITRTDKGYLLLFIALYAFHVLGMFWTENVSHGLFDLQVKMPLVLVPLLLFTSPLDREDLMNAGRGGLIVGALTSALVCYAHATYFYFEIGKFTDKTFSFYLHQGYHAAFLCAGAFLLVELMVRHHGLLSGIARIAARIAVLIMASAVFMTWSRTGAIVTVLGAIFVTINVLVKWKTKRNILLALAGIGLASSLLLVKADNLSARFTGLFSTMQNLEHLDKTATDANSTRIFLFDISTDIISDHFFQGIGTGDIKDELTARAEVKGYSGLAKMNLNVHNQNLQVFATLGFPALLVFLIIILLPFVEALRRRSLLLLLFATLFALFNLTESYVERQLGVMFFSFMLPLLIFHFRHFRSDPLK